MLTHILSLATALAVATAADNPYTQYPSVAKTATYNGFGDKVYDHIDACAQECVIRSASDTACPYWDIGCLCVMSPWSSPVSKCVAEKCKGEQVEGFLSAATSACKAAGVWSSYWIINAAAASSLSSAAAQTPDVVAPSSSVVPSSVEAPSSAPAPSSASSPSSAPAPSSALALSSAVIRDSEQSQSPAITSSPSSSSRSATAVPRTATINGFADRVSDNINDCAKGCVKRDTSGTPCPYWEMGCLCVFPTFANPVAECVATYCKGQNVVDFLSVASSACSAYGVPAPYFRINATASSLLSVAAAQTGIASSAILGAPLSSASPLSSAAASPSDVVDPVSSAPVLSTPVPAASSAPVSEAASADPAAVSSDPVSQEASSFASEVSVSSAAPAKNSSSEVVVDSTTLIVTNTHTVISTICTKCVTLTGEVTTYATVIGNATVTVTEECKPTPAASLTTYTTVVNGVTKTVTEECSTPVASYTTYTTVIKGVTKTITEECTTPAAFHPSAEHPSAEHPSAEHPAAAHTTVAGEVTQTITSKVAGASSATKDSAKAPKASSATAAAASSPVIIAANSASGFSLNWILSVVAVFAAALF